MLLLNDLGPLSDLALLLPLDGIIYDLLAASLDNLLLQNGGLVCFSVVSPVVQLIVASFDNWYHAAPAEKADAEHEGERYPKRNDVVARHPVA